MSTSTQEDSKWSKASLLIFSDTLKPEEITARLGLIASTSHEKGASRLRVPIPWKNSLWGLQSTLGDHRNLADHIQWLIDVIEPKADALKELSKHCKVLVFCGFASQNGQGGFTLTPPILARLAALNIPLSLDLYPPGPVGETIQTEPAS